MVRPIFLLADDHGGTNFGRCLAPYVLLSGRLGPSASMPRDAAIPISGDSKTIVAYTSELQNGQRLWTQTLTDATTNKVLASYKKGTGAMAK